jgi:hypothetical protein
MNEYFPIFTFLKTNIMASRRELKKDIHFITFELISECLVYKHFHPETPDEKIDTVIENIIRHRNDYLSRVNKPDGKDTPSLVKKHYRSIIDDLKNKTIPLLDGLEN